MSLLLGALYLLPLDWAKQKTGLFYARFMDDWIIISEHKYKLRKAIKIVNQTLTLLKLEKHPDKTFILKVSKGVDFLGFTLYPEHVTLSCTTLRNTLSNIARLYEQAASKASRMQR